MDPEFDWLTLDADEEVVWSDTPHPYSLVPAIVVGVLLAVVLVGVVVLVGAYLAHKNTNYVVTSEALYKKTGVLSRNVQRIEFDKVQDTSYRQSFLGAHFGYGTVDVSTAGGGGVEMSFGNVTEPLEVQTLINERLRATRGRPDDERRSADAVLAEILSELRAIRSAVEDAPVDRSDPAGDPAESSHPDGPDSDDSAPSSAEDPTGRLDGAPTADPADGRSAVSDEVAPEPSDDVASNDGGSSAGGDGPPTGTDPDAFEFEDGQ